jgi:PriA DNA helicase Cys-rich region (CRR) domain
MVSAIMCPQCNAPLAPHRFAQSIVCSYCGATVRLDESSVSASLFHEALRVWNSPASSQFSSWISMGGRHWALEKLIAQGHISDVYTARLARWPTELAILKLLRDRQDIELFDNEWDALQILQKSDAPGADTFTMLMPQPILHGDISEGSFAGQRVSIFRWASGFYHTFDDVIRAYPQGIPPRASIWIWRRILEILSFIHASGMAHGAVLPAHLLIQENEHGVRLVGYNCTGRLNEKLRNVSPGYESFYPKTAQSSLTLTAPLDLVMSARCIVASLGGKPETASLPKTIPALLAGIVRRIALSDPAGSVSEDAWTIREELGKIATKVYGPSTFIPIVMPS